MNGCRRLAVFFFLLFWGGVSLEAEVSEKYAVGPIVWRGVESFPPWFFSPLVTVSVGETLTEADLHNKLSFSRKLLEQSGLVTSVTISIALMHDTWQVTIHVVENTERGLTSLGLVSQWGDRDFWGPGNLFLISASPWKQEMRASTWRPGGWPLDLAFLVNHQMGLRLPLSEISSQGWTSLRTTALLVPQLSLYAEPFFQAEEQWSSMSFKDAGGLRSGITFDGHLWKEDLNDWDLNGEFALGHFFFGEGTGISFAQGTAAATWSSSELLAFRVAPSWRWANGESPFLWVFSPFGGLLPGSATGVWSLTTGVETQLYRSPGVWALSWTLEPRVVAAGWVEESAMVSETHWGVGFLTKFRIGSWGDHGMSFEATFDPTQALWFWKFGLE